ncbi:MAG: hypothetical protein AAF485_27415 [Chloroflexota bacterium]
MSRWFKNAQAIELPPETQATINNYAPGYWQPIIAAGAFFLAIVMGLWHAGVYLLTLLGYSDGERAMAGLISGLVALAALILFLSYFFKVAFDRWSAYKLEMKRLEIDHLRVMHQLQGSVVADSRAVAPEQKRRNALIVALMTDAFNGESNFSYRKAGQYILVGESKPVGRGSKVVQDALGWLKEQGAIEGNRLTGRFTSVGDVQRALHLPVVQGQGWDSTSPYLDGPTTIHQSD